MTDHLAAVVHHRTHRDHEWGEDRARDEAAIADHESSGGAWAGVLAKGRALCRPVFHAEGPDRRLFGVDDDPDLRIDVRADLPGGWQE